MKPICLAAVFAALIVGCAAPGTRIETDHDRIAAIDRIALKRGVQVLWVNVPYKVVKDGAGS
jgi:hypothetical protein